MTPPLLVAVLVLVATPVLAQVSTPVSSITNATWKQYRAEYRQSPLCSKDEITLWSCEAGKRVYSLCSSQVVNRSSGYMQYRASSRGKIVFIYPPEKRPPLGLFTYASSANGDAYVEFTSGEYGYTLADPLRGESAIFVSALGPSRKETEIRCQGNQTLQVNYTMRLMYDSGVWPGY